MEIVSCVIDTPEAVKAATDAIQLAMTVDIKPIENYGFPEGLPVEISLDVGYAWGKSMTLKEYCALKAE